MLHISIKREIVFGGNYYYDVHGCSDTTDDNRVVDMTTVDFRTDDIKIYDTDNKPHSLSKILNSIKALQKINLPQEDKKEVTNG